MPPDARQMRECICRETRNDMDVFFVLFQTRERDSPEMLPGSKIGEIMVILSLALPPIIADICLLIAIESSNQLRSRCSETHWLASPSPSILGTYGAGISRRYNLSQSTSANQPWAKMSEDPARRLPYRFVKSAINRFLSNSFARVSK